MTINQIRDYIESSEMFRPGAEFPETVITDFVGIEAPELTQDPVELRRNVNGHQLRKAAAQNKFNRVLAKRGLYMSQHNYTQYRIKSLPEVAQKVRSFQREASTKAYRGAELSRGFRRHKGILTHIDDTELVQ